MLEGAAIALVSLMIGYAVGRRRKSLPKATVATCGCKHARSMHADNGKGKCWYIDPDDWWFVQDKDGSTRKRSCGCQHYDGPEPLTTLFAPEISG